MHVLLVNLSIDLTGASRSSLVDSDSTSLPDFDRQLMMGVTSDEIDMLKQTANSAIHDSLLKKIQEIDQVRYLCGQWFGSVCNSWWKPWDSLKVLHISYLCGIIEITLGQLIFTDCQFFMGFLYFPGFTFMCNEWRLFYNLFEMLTLW